MSGVATLQVTSHVDIVVTNNTTNQIGGRDALGALSGQKFALSLERRVDVLMALSGIGYIVVCHEIDLVLAQKLVGEGPGRVGNHLVHVATMTNGFVPLEFVHDRAALLAIGQLVIAHANDQVGVGQKVFGLHELTRMTRVK